MQETIINDLQEQLNAGQVITLANMCIDSAIGYSFISVECLILEQ
jgi:hypothetical protein